MIKSAQKQGLTFIELLVVMLLFGTLALITTPYLFGYQEKQQLEKEANQITENLRLAQQKSIAAEKGQSYGINFNSAASYILFPDSKTIELKENIFIDSVLPSSISFAKLTGKPSSMLELTLVSKKYKAQVKVNTLGVVIQTPIEKR